MDMLNVIIGILSLGGTVFAIGYQIGKDNCRKNCCESCRERCKKTQK